MAIVRRIVLGGSLLILVPSVLILLEIIPIQTEAPITNMALISTIISTILSIVSAGMEVRAISENLGMPEPEDPPISSLPDLSRYQKMEEIEVMKKAVESVEEAEDYAHRSNGHIKISINVDVDEEDDETEL